MCVVQVKAEAYDDVRVSRVYFSLWQNQLLSSRTRCVYNVCSVYRVCV